MKKRSSRHKQKKENTTFDPKIHHKSKAGTGYGLKRDYVVTPEESSGKQLEYIFNKELKKTT